MFGVPRLASSRRIFAPESGSSAGLAGSGRFQRVESSYGSHHAPPGGSVDVVTVTVETTVSVRVTVVVVGARSSKRSPYTPAATIAATRHPMMNARLIRWRPLLPFAREGRPL